MPTQAPNLVELTESVMVVVVLVIALYIVTLCFIRSVRKTMQKVPSSMKTISTGLIWVLLVPGVSYVIAWIMLPFTIPRSIHKAVQEQGSTALAKTVSLSRAGLSLCILGLLFLATFVWIMALSHQTFGAHNIPQHSVLASGLLLVFAVAQLVTLIVYWCKLISVRVELDVAFEQRFVKEDS